MSGKNPVEKVQRTGKIEAHEASKVDKELNRLSGSYFIFVVVMAIVFLALAIMFSINSYYFDQVRKAIGNAQGSQVASGVNCGLSKGEADGLFYANIAFAVVTGVIFLALVVILFVGVWKPKAVEKFRASTAKVLNPVGQAGATGLRKAGAAAYAGGKELGAAGYRAGKEIGAGAGKAGQELGTGAMRAGGRAMAS